ncbi:universal stress protein [Cellulomonas sp. URHB0016]
MSRTRPRPWSGPVPLHPVVVGVHPDQDRTVVVQAAGIARALGTGLVCVWVDPSQVTVGREPDGTLDTTPMDPDRDDDVDDDLDGSPAEALLFAHVSALLVHAGISWRFEYVTGETARGLHAAAEAHDAPLIAVGTRRPGLGGWMAEVVGGSVAGHLAHTQDRPVLVVPAQHGTAR